MKTEIRLSIGYSLKTTGKYVIAVLDNEKLAGYLNKDNAIVAMSDNIALFETAEAAKKKVKTLETA